MMPNRKTNFQCWLILLISLLSDELILAQESENEVRILVVDGVPADPKEFPHIARLGNRNASNVTNWFCGGTLISNRLVLTAAHCLYSESGEVNAVRLGELEFDSVTDDAQPEDFGINSIKEHPNYKYPLVYHDIAIIQLNRWVLFNYYKFPACLPSTGRIGNEQLTAIGWGHTTFGGTESKKLQKVHLKDFGNRCRIDTDIVELPNGFNDSSQLCIGSADRQDTCSGDSGGPLLIKHDTYFKYQVVGITSTGFGCGNPNVASIYTRVYFYVDWIRREIDKLKQQEQQLSAFGGQIPFYPFKCRK